MMRLPQDGALCLRAAAGVAAASLAIVFMLSIAVPASAQQALVLSGGGARGLAHVGVIERLSELGYDPDIVVGNSIGAVVGALYAAGYGPEELREDLRRVHWSELFDPTPIVLGPDRMLRVPAITTNLNVGRLRASRGFFGQWRVNRALAGLLFDANARSRGDFDRLARRFRAVAADLKTGAVVVLDSGDVARAVRASMAFPGFFSPVEWDGRVLVDGGIVDNFPTDVARSLEATYVVGVDVVRPPPEIHSRAPFAVVDRAVSLMLENLHRYNATPDALVTPIVTENFVGPSFPADPRPLMQVGYDAARRDLASVQLPENRRTERVLPPAPAGFSGLLVEAPDSALAALARRVFAPVVTRPYDAAAVLTAMDRLYATGILEAVWPRVIAGVDSAAMPRLLVRLEAAPRVALSAGAHFENDRGGRAWASADVHARTAHLPAVFSFAASGGKLERWATASARIYALSRRSLAFSFGGHLLERDVRVFETDALRTSDVVRAGGWAGIEFPHILREQMIVAMARAEWIDAEDGPSGRAIGPLLRFATTTSEDRVVGLPFMLEGERRWGDITYTRVTLSGSRSFGHLGPRLAVGIDLHATSSAAPLDVQPALGDEHAMPGLRWGELRGRARAIAGFDVAVPIGSAFGRLRTRIGAVTNDLDGWDSARWVKGAQLGVYWQTPLGNLEAGYGVATEGHGRVEISMGRAF